MGTPILCGRDDATKRQTLIGLDNYCLVTNNPFSFLHRQVKCCDK